MGFPSAVIKVLMTLDDISMRKETKTTGGATRQSQNSSTGLFAL